MPKAPCPFGNHQTHYKTKDLLNKREIQCSICWKKIPCIELSKYQLIRKL